MPRSARKSQQARQDAAGVTEKTTPVVSIQPDYYAQIEANKSHFTERALAFIGGGYRECRDLEMIGAVVEILENHRGCTTPFEDFVWHVLHGYVRETCTPESVLDHVETFREAFADAILEARAMLRRHPDLINAPEEPGCLGKEAADQWNAAIDRANPEDYPAQG